MAKIILIELNEVPEIIFRRSFLKSKYNKKINDFDFIPTYSSDNGHLHPWVTWSTVHRGVNNEIHKIKEINDFPVDLDIKYPTVMSSLADEGYKVGIFGSLQSSSIKQNCLSKYCFIVPDAFSNSYNCKPRSVTDLNRLNLIMSRASARVVNKSLPRLTVTLKGLISYLRHAYRGRAILRIVKQLITEIFMPWVKTRRRNLQADILFDVFMDLLQTHKPDLSTFFSNHVASNMHRFWEATYPHKYLNQISSADWINRYKNEIDIAMSSTAYFINSLTEFVDNEKDTQLWILSSMGQKEVNNYQKQNHYWEITNLGIFLKSLCAENFHFEQIPQMIPNYGIKADSKTINKISKCLEKIKSNHRFEISSFNKNSLTLSFGTALNELTDENLLIWDNETMHKKEYLGVEKKTIEEFSGSSAYHVPEGIFYRYGHNLKNLDKYKDEKGFIPTDQIKKIVESTIKEN